MNLCSPSSAFFWRSNCRLRMSRVSGSSHSSESTFPLMLIVLSKLVLVWTKNGQKNSKIRTFLRNNVMNLLGNEYTQVWHSKISLQYEIIKKHLQSISHLSAYLKLNIAAMLYRILSDSFLHCGKYLATLVALATLMLEYYVNHTE